MDGHPNPKSKKWKAHVYSETRYAIIKWLEKELPLLSGSLINLGAGGWEVPRQLINHAKITDYKTFDRKFYGDNANKVDFYGDLQNMSLDWSGKWDNAICIEVIECIQNPFKAFDEMYRILKPGGTLLLTCPFNYRFFGENTGLPKKKHRVHDFWRITRDGLELLAKQFSNVKIEGFGGTGDHDRYCYVLKAIK